MNLNESKKPDETDDRRLTKTAAWTSVIVAGILITIVVMAFSWVKPDTSDTSLPGRSNDSYFHNPMSEDDFNPPTPPTPPSTDEGPAMVCSSMIDACATQASLDLEIGRITNELESRGLPIGSEDVIMRDAQMSHIITDVCYQPTEGTYLAGESLWGDVWVNTPQTNRPMRFMSALSSVCSDELDMLQGYLRPKNPYEDPSYNGNVPSMPPSEYTPPMPPAVNEGSTHTPTPPESAPSTSEQGHN